MKVENVSTESLAFNPIVLEVTIENADEALDLWHRLGISAVVLREASTTGGLQIYGLPMPGQNCSAPLWKAIDEELVKQGLRKL